MRVLVYPVAKEREKVVMESIPQLRYFNNTRVVWKEQGKGYTLKYLNKERLDKIQAHLNHQFTQILHFEAEYLDDSDP